jgi:hypothetical protein
MISAVLENVSQSPYLCPVLQADLEDLSVINARNLDEIVVCVQQQGLLLRCFDESKVDREEVGEEHGQVRDELLIVIVGVVVGRSNIWIAQSQRFVRLRWWRAYLCWEGSCC